ncbi:MAG: magnesium/cobalt transporter CorA [Bacteroidetes bacterium]|nr:magnesium/cobalt transporter CorA [Bacteroidota bacterium]
MVAHLVNLHIKNLMSNCQLYQYNAAFFAIKKESSHYFADNFLEGDIDTDHVYWLNYHGLEDRNAIEQLAKKLGIDKLVIEALYTPTRRPKVEEYPTFLFFSVKSLLPNEHNDNSLIEDKISFILNENYLISYQDKSSDHFTDVRDRIEKARGKIRIKGPDFLLYRMLESIIDNYFEVLSDCTKNIEAIDGQILKYQSKQLFRELENEKRKLISLRKIVLPMREISNELLSSDSKFIEKDNARYFQNLQKSCASILEEIDANKQIIEGISNLYYAAQGQRMNEIMKFLTVVSSIFIPLTFIVGVYGMNFKYMPELDYPYGYYTVVGLMILLSLILLFYFIRKGWLKREE